MKNMLLTGSLVLCTSVAALAHTPVAPSYQTEQQFEIDFPGATNVGWMAGENEEATFMYKGQRLTAFYDNDNQLIGTVTDASYDDLPAIAKKQIEKHYKGYVPEKVIMFDDNEDVDAAMVLYGTVFDDKDNYFVELQGAHKTIIVQVTMRGDVGFFKEL